jgi:hypothetical protein
VFRQLGGACIARAAFTFGCDESAQELTIMTIARGEHGACLPAATPSAASSLPGAIAMACSVSRQRLAGDGVGVPSIPLGNAYLCFIEVAEIQLSQFDCALGPNTDPVLHH